MKDDIEQIVEIRDKEIDTEAIMRQIRENIRQRREIAREQGVDFDAFVDGLYRKGEGHFASEVYYNLRRASSSYDRITVKRYISPRQIPIIGPLIQRVRISLHDLVIYYVNMLGSKQVSFNEAMVYVLSNLLKGLEKDAEQKAVELAALREEIQKLRIRVTELEERT